MTYLKPPSPSPGALDPPNEPLPDASVSLTIQEPSESEAVSESKTLGVSQGHNTISERRSPRLNGDRQHRAVKKFRPPDNMDMLTPEMGGLSGIRARRAAHHCDHRSRSKGRGSSPESRSVSRERKRSPGKVEEKEVETKKEEEEVSQPEESR